MEFCDNIVQLLQAYFRDFSVERLEKPWKAFTASWSKAIIARNLGTDSSVIYSLYKKWTYINTCIYVRRVKPDPVCTDVHPVFAWVLH